MISILIGESNCLKPRIVMKLIPEGSKEYYSTLKSLEHDGYRIHDLFGGSVATVLRGAFSILKGFIYSSSCSNMSALEDAGVVAKEMLDILEQHDLSWEECDIDTEILSLLVRVKRIQDIERWNKYGY